MSIPYLNTEGLRTLWALAKQKFLGAGATAVKAQSLFYGITSNSASAMTANISGITSYYVGLTVILKMGAAPASGCTVNINGIGAKTLKWRAQTSGAYFTSGATYMFVYDGTYFTAIHSYDSNTIYGTATTTAAGLMGAADKKQVDGTVIATTDIDAM